ncbi:MAG: trimethylamine methyltransferase family protein, partial [Verrucomicrobia bacterium]|nr:trimethylamine methyltransferase family protein [Verrucomicrobiota bacterium]
EVFKKAGATVNESANLVRIPRSMIEDAVDSAPSRLVLCGRDPKNDCILEGSNVYLGTGGTAINVLDMKTGERRPSTNRDVRGMARIMDALDNIHVFTINVYPNDIKEKDEIDVNRFYSSLTNTSKHIMGGIYSAKGLHDVVEMSALMAGGMDKLRERPFVSFITLIISPLKIDDVYGEFTCYLAKEGIPVVVPTEPLCGTTSPITLAANVVIHTAETLAGVVMTQLVRRGAPVICGSVGSITDMRTMGHLSGPIERGLVNAGVSQMAQHYKLPYYSTAGMTDSKTVDCQAGYESGMMNLLVAMSGANYIHDAAGLMEFDLTASYEKMVIDDEIIGRCLRVLRGIEVTDETIALDVMLEVGAGGNFLAEEHTIRHMRTEFAPNTISDREHREAWAAAGSKDTFVRAHEAALKILKEHVPLAIDPQVDRQVRKRFPAIRDA